MTDACWDSVHCVLDVGVATKILGGFEMLNRPTLTAVILSGRLASLTRIEKTLVPTITPVIGTIHWYDLIDAVIDDAIVRSSKPLLNNSILMLEMVPLNVHPIVSVLPRMT